MARLPSGQFLVQQIGGTVILFEDGSEREIVRAEAADAGAMGKAQEAIIFSRLSDLDKAWAHFWFGYFYAHASRTLAPEPLIQGVPSSDG